MNYQKQLTICFVIPYSFDYFGGVQQQTLHLGAALEKLGANIFYISPTRGTKNLPKHHLTIGTSVRIPNLNGSWSSLSVADVTKKEVSGLVTRYKIDLFHFQEVLSPFVSYQLLQLSPVKNVVTAHAGWNQEGGFKTESEILRALGARIREKIDQGVAVSPVAAKCGSFYLPQDTIIIPNAVDLSLYKNRLPRPKELDNERFNLIFVGRFEVRKGVSYLLRALAALPSEFREKVNLCLIGSGPRSGSLKILTSFLELQDCVCFCGQVSEKKKASFLQHGDIFVSPAYRGESFGIVLVEAMAAGCPLIAGNNDGYSALLEKYPWSKAVVDVKNTKQFADSIKELVQNHRLRKKLSRWGIKYSSRFEAEVIARRYMKVYEKVLRS